MINLMVTSAMFPQWRLTQLPALVCVPCREVEVGRGGEGGSQSVATPFALRLAEGEWLS